MASEDFDTYDLPTASPPKPQLGHKKSWLELRNTTRETRKLITRITPSIPSNFGFRHSFPELDDGEELPVSFTRLYFLGVHEKGKDSTLLMVDIDNVEQESEIEKNSNNTYWMSPVFDSQPGTNAVPMSREEQLMRERKRLGTYGITSYELDPDDGLFVIPANNSLFLCRDVVGPREAPVEIPTKTHGARLDPKICPCNNDMVAFINDYDIWLTGLCSGKEVRLTYSRKGELRLEDDPISSGVPSFVIQEEFDRYTGYWWSPVFHRIAEGKRMYHIVYEEVDESDVEILSIFSPTGQEPNCSELYRYPKAGANNAYSNLKLLEIVITYSGPTTQITDIQVKNLSMKEPLFHICPWAEYLSRAGWTRDGKYIYAVVIDRTQTRQAVLLISPSIFYETSTKNISQYVQCIYEESSDIWINVHDLLYFFPQTSENKITFIYASEKSGYRHLYLYTSQLNTGVAGHQIGQGDATENYACCKILKEFAITSGDWVVLPKELWVDEARKMVYFLGLKDSPLESHLYVTRYDQPSSVVQLTQPGYSHSVQIDQHFSMFVTVFSSLQSPPQSSIFKIIHKSSTVRSLQMGLLCPKIDTFGYTPPTLFNYVSRAGHVAYGLYFLPRGWEQGKRYPTVLFVYGGPQVQMVNNSFKGQKFLRLHTLAAEGYVVVVIDGRGSNNRGLQFEGILKHKLGTVEINDQVEGLLWLASQTDFIDMSRVAIHGWSYGGYLSLMGLTQRSDIFKVAIAGAPVVNWELYDTGYTERYIGLPQRNPDVYKAGNVLTYMDKLPDYETRLLLIHGLIDENVHFRHSSILINYLVTSCKPHQLQIYPNERHGIRNHEASEHYKTTVLKFLQDYL
ncbi:dipeptidyl peptidase 9-like [Physella acuta]|uniref:dipeptidyl peptidase 9-like n=1 Tax=Physella acuta TaxID=109671 RepID=UPI0027DD7C62|nr:dipeptidyl peptidase 9-like [Physella acuta]